MAFGKISLGCHTKANKQRPSCLFESTHPCVFITLLPRCRVPTRKRLFARPQLSYPDFSGSPHDRIGQPLEVSYSSSLLLPCLPVVPPRVNRQSEIPTLDECRSSLTTALPLLRVFSGWLRCISWRTPTLAWQGFPGQRFQKSSGTRYTTSTPTNTLPRHTLSNAPSMGCKYRLQLSGALGFPRC